MDFIYSFSSSNYSVIILAGVALSFVWDLFQGDKNSRIKNGRRGVSFRDFPELYSLYLGFKIFVGLVVLSAYTGINPLVSFHNGWLELAGCFTGSVLFAYILSGAASSGRINDNASDLDLPQDTFDRWQIGELEGTNLPLDEIKSERDPGVAPSAVSSS